MKRIILTVALVLGMMSSQSFGFDLLDRMLGSKGCGCASSCCETEPACGCEAPARVSAAEPACDCEATAASGCAEATGGCEAPACGGCDSGCDSGSGCFGKKRGGLLSKLFGCKKGCGCDSTPSCGCAEPACGCEAPASGGCDSGCDSGCGLGKKHGGLLSKLFGCKKGCGCDSGCDSGCDAGSSSGCGCGSAMPMPAAPMINAAPMAPLPVVDPSASNQSKRRVIQASARYVH